MEREWSGNTDARSIKTRRDFKKERKKLREGRDENGEIANLLEGYTYSRMTVCIPMNNSKCQGKSEGESIVVQGGSLVV